MLPRHPPERGPLGRHGPRLAALPRGRVGHGAQGSDAQLTPFGPLCATDGGPAVLLAEGGAPSTVVVLGGDVAGGPPGDTGSFAGCGPAQPGPAMQADHGSATLLPGLAPTLGGPATATAGSGVTLDLSGAPGAGVLVGASAGAASLKVPPLVGVLLLAPPFAAVAAGTTDGAGALAFSFTAPPPAPGTEAAQLYAQAVFVGVELAISSGTALTFLAPGL